MEEQFKLFKYAYETYNLDKREDVSKEVLEYIRERLIANKDLIEQLIEITGENLIFEDIINLFDNEVKQENIYKKEKKSKLNELGFISSIYSTSIGVVCIETPEPLLIIKYFVTAIKSRNSIIISDIEFAEESIKSAFWIIFAEALKKFDINPNIINIIPYEECNYDLFDKVIIVDENQLLDNKRITDEIFIYIEDEYFEEEVQKEIEYLKQISKNPIVIRNSFEDTIEKINKNRGYASCIYTKNAQIGYDFINLVKTSNAFINSSIGEFAEEMKQHKNSLYMNKKIMYEYRSIKDNSQNEKVSEILEIENQNLKENKEYEQNVSLIKYETTPWYKIILNKFIELKNKIFGSK